jgi:NAD-dependent dihydropyrimidine dehydrogenase PreA subunit
MTNEPYEQLADALDRLPNGFPRTPSGVEIELLKRIFSPEEAQLAGQLSHKMEPIEEIAERVGRPKGEVRTELMQMVRRGLIWFDRADGTARFRLAPFVVGIYEAQLHNLDADLAQLVEQYMADGGAEGIMRPQPALHRVIPVQQAIKSDQVLPYDDVRALLMEAKTFRVRDCICRVQQDLVAQRCDASLANCLSFSTSERAPRPGDITREEALAILDQTEEEGLVHTISNTIEGIGYICNCCSCCCGILRGISDYGITTSVAYANYFAVIDPDECTACGICIDRCQVGAISERQDGIAVVDQEHCIGCGLCVTGCPDEVPLLQRKAEAEIIHPPVDFETWQQARLQDRGLGAH